MDERMIFCRASRFLPELSRKSKSRGLYKVTENGFVGGPESQTVFRYFDFKHRNRNAQSALFYCGEDSEWRVLSRLFLTRDDLWYDYQHVVQFFIAVCGVWRSFGYGQKAICESNRHLVHYLLGLRWDGDAELFARFNRCALGAFQGRSHRSENGLRPMAPNSTAQADANS